MPSFPCIRAETMPGPFQKKLCYEYNRLSMKLLFPLPLPLSVFYEKFKITLERFQNLPKFKHEQKVLIFFRKVVGF